MQFDWCVPSPYSCRHKDKIRTKGNPYILVCRQGNLRQTTPIQPFCLKLQQNTSQLNSKGQSLCWSSTNNKQSNKYSYYSVEIFSWFQRHIQLGFVKRGGRSQRLVADPGFFLPGCKCHDAAPALKKGGTGRRIPTHFFFNLKKNWGRGDIYIME